MKDSTTGRRRTMRPRSEWVIIESPELAVIAPTTWQACETRARAQKRDTATKRGAGKGPGGSGPKYLFSGLLKCGECGGAYIIISRTQYGCATHKDRGPSVCANALKVKRTTIEQVLLAGVKAELLSDDAYRAFEAEARALLKAERPDPARARRRLAQAQKELDNLMAAIRAGIITATTKQALEDAERQAQDARDELQAIEHFEPAQILPRARDLPRPGGKPRDR